MLISNSRRTARGRLSLLDSMNNARRRRKRQHREAPRGGAIQQLEDRTLLAAVVPAATAGAFSALTGFLDTFIDGRDVIPDEAQQRLRSDLGIGSAVSYQAFVGEENDISISQQLGDLLYVVDEGNNQVPVLSVPLAFHPDVINDLSVGFSFVVEVTVDIGDFFHAPDADSVVPNGTSLLELVPVVGGHDGILTEMVNTLGSGLSFGLGEIVEFVGEATDFLQETVNRSIGPIVDSIGSIAEEICDAIDSVPFVNTSCPGADGFSQSILSALDDSLEALPTIPAGLLGFGQTLVDGLTTSFTSDSVYVDVLDGFDNVDLSTLTDASQIVYAGSGNDTVIAGGGSDPIQLYGQSGNDTFLINFRFDVDDWNVDGGDDNDVIQVFGTDADDVIRLVGSGGQLSEVILEAANPAAGVTANEVQTISLPPNVTGGTFTLSFDGQTTGAIPASAPASGIGSVQEALENLSNLAVGDVSVSGSPGGPYTVSFGGAFTNIDVPDIETDGSGLTVDGGSISVRTIVESTSSFGTNEIQTVALPDIANGGTFTLTFNGNTTGPIAHDASASSVQASLGALTSIAGNNVEVSGPNGGPWDVEFVGTLSQADQPVLIANGAALTSPTAATVTETTAGVSGTNEVQQIGIPGGVTGGTFTLTFNGDTTTPIRFDATAGEVQTAIQQLGSILAPGNIEVDGSNGGPWNVEFVEGLRELNVSAFTANSDALIGGVSLGVATTTPASGANEIHTLSLARGTGSFYSGVVNGGMFTMTVDAPDPTVPGLTISRTTAPIPFDATASEFQAALEALSNVGPGNVQVVKSATSDMTGTFTTWTVSFVGDLAGVDITPNPAANFDLSGLFTTGGVFSDTSVIDGVPGNDEVQTITPSTTLTSGTFTLTFDGETTAPIVFDADGSDVQAALESLSNIVPGDISVSGPAAGPWTVTFDGGTFAQTNVPQITTNAGGLGGALSVSIIDNLVPAAPGTGEVQNISFSPPANSGTFRLSFDGQETSNLAFNASAATVQAALQALPTVGAGNATVAGTPGGPFTVSFGGALRALDVSSITVDTAQLVRTGLTVNVTDNATPASLPNEKQRIALPFGVTGGDFTLEFGGDTTGAISFDANGSDIETALGLLPSIGGAANINVTGPSRGPWNVEFVGTFTNTDVQLITANGAGLDIDGTSLTVVETVRGNNGAATVELARTTVSSISNIEALQVFGEGGNDTLIVDGDIGLPAGVFFDGGDGTDRLEMISDAATPTFVAPIFPDVTQANLNMDGMAVQFVNVEDGVTFDAAGNAGDVTVTGDNAGNDIRFAGVSSGRATFSNDSQVALTLRNFGTDTTVTVDAAQGDDDLSIAPNGVSEFSQFVVDGNGPFGSDSVRFEGTVGIDEFAYSPNPADTNAAEDRGKVVYDLGAGNFVDIDFAGFADVLFAGRGGVDNLLVCESLEVSAGSLICGEVASDDTILFSPRVAGGGSFEYISQTTGVRFAPVDFLSLESHEFNLGTGVDTVSVSTEDLPGVNSSASVVGGSGMNAGTTTIDFGVVPLTFTHDIAEPDIVTLEIGTHTDEVTVSPGVGINIEVNSSFGDDTLIVEAADAPLTVDLSANRLSQPGFGDITHTAIHQVELIGAGSNDLTAVSSDLAPVHVRPMGGDAGEFSSPAVLPDYSFDSFTGMIGVEFNNAQQNEVIIQGSHEVDVITASAVSRTVSVSDASGTALIPVVLGNGINVATIQALGADDTIRVLPDPTGGDELLFNVDGGAPNASDRLVVEDQGVGNTVQHHQGPDERSGSVHVGALPPVSYEGIEFVDIRPLDPVTGGTGADGLGRIVVFHPDTFSHNNDRLTATEFDDLFEHTARPNISPGGQVDPFGASFDLPGDEDWYVFRATRTATLEFTVLHEPVGTLANGQPGLPGDGRLRLDLYKEDGSPVTRLPSETDPAVQGASFVDGDVLYLRVHGETVDAINKYDITFAELGTSGPRVFDPDGALDDDHGVHVTSAPEFNLFDVKPSQGPTPAATSITVHFRDDLERRDGNPYPALNEFIAAQNGHYSLVGDHTGIVSISEIIVTNDPVVIGEPATATVELRFDPPLPDDRFTLTVADNLLNPAAIMLDGESDADEPNGDPAFPSGDGEPGGDFVARFTIDSRPELAAVGQGSVSVDSNSNFAFDAVADGQTGAEAVNRDFVFLFGVETDTVFAGQFGPGSDVDGYDRLGAYGKRGGIFRFVLDFNNDGRIVTADGEAEVISNLQINAIPVAGNFDGDPANGDEVGLFDGTSFYLDMEHDNNVGGTGDVTINVSPGLQGVPIVGDFDGDGLDDLGVYRSDSRQFAFDLANNGLDGDVDATIDTFMDTEIGLLGAVDSAFNFGDYNLDGIDDIGLKVSNRNGVTPSEESEWYILISDATAGSVGTVQGLNHPYSPSPLGDDLFAQFGFSGSVPVAGNFDPPINDSGPSPIEVSFDSVSGQLSVSVTKSIELAVTSVDGLLQLRVDGAVDASYGVIATADIQTLSLAGSADGDVIDLSAVTGTEFPVLGNVTVDGRDGNDTLIGSQLDDVLTGGSGNDLLTGNAGADTLNGGGGKDDLSGGPGNDVVRGQGSTGDTLEGGDGDDILDGGSGNDIVRESSTGDLTLTNSTMAGRGNDTLSNLERALLSGSSGSQRIDAGGFFVAGVTSTTLLGHGGEDTIVGSDGNDMIDGGGGSDLIDARSGNDRLFGGSGADSLFGGEGNDYLRGLGGSGDRLQGGPGNDTLNGGRGIDRLIESGDVDFTLTQSVLIGQGTDTVRAIEIAELNGGSSDNVIDVSGFTSANGFTLIRGNGGNDFLVGSDGRDILNGGAGDDTLQGKGGDDRLLGEVGSDRISGHSGNDWIEGGRGFDIVLGGEGNDTLTGGNARDTLIGGHGDDQIAGNDGADTLVGGTGNNDASVGDTLTDATATIDEAFTLDPLPAWVDQI